MADGRTVQIGVRVTPAEKALYDQYRGDGLTADASLSLVLHRRFSETPPAVRMPPKITVYEDTPDIEADTEVRAGVRVPRMLPKGFKPDFKGKK